jgi:hypothetical protein
MPDDNVFVFDTHPPYQVCITERIPDGVRDHWFNFNITTLEDMYRAKKALNKLIEVTSGK